AAKIEDIFHAVPRAARVHNDWDQESTTVRLVIDPDRANLAGVTNSDVASSTTAALSGINVATLREGQKQIPVVARLRIEERAQLSDIQNLYVYSAQSTQKVPLVQISSIKNDLESQRIRRQEHFRTISVECTPAAGALSSEILSAAMPKLLRSEEHTSELQSPCNLVCRLLLEKKKKISISRFTFTFIL